MIEVLERLFALTGLGAVWAYLAYDIARKLKAGSFDPNRMFLFGFRSRPIVYRSERPIEFWAMIALMTIGTSGVALWWAIYMYLALTR